MPAERMPNCDLYLADNTGHKVQFERADLFNRLCELGFDMALPIGQHTSDKELSCYARAARPLTRAGDAVPALGGNGVPGG